MNVLKLFPSTKREWAEEMLNGDHSGLAMLKLLVLAWILTLRSDRAMRTALTTLSLVNIVAGIGLGALIALTDTPVVVTLLAGVLILQGGYTLLATRAHERPLSGRIWLIGETLALTVGGGGLLVSTVRNAGAVDPEYGPMTVAILLTAHAVVGLTVLSRSVRPRSSA